MPNSSASTMLMILAGSLLALLAAGAAGLALAVTVRTVVLAAAGFLAVAFLVEAAFLVAI